MPNPLITVLQLVPWGEVVANAPRLAEGAKKLWQTLARKPAAAGTAVAPSPHLQPAERIAALESAVAVLQQDVATSAELVASMAEQNAQLVLAVATLRARVRWLAALSVAAAVAAVAGWAWG